MIDLDFLESLIRAVDESSIDSVEIERGGTRIRVSKSPPQAPPTAHVQHPHPPAQAGDPGIGDEPGAEIAGVKPGSGNADEEDGGDDGSVAVPSPMVGTFYRAPAPDAPPYVDVGDRVAEGDTLCIIEAMKLMNELEAEVSGTVVEVCVDNAEPVEYGQALFRIDPT